MQRRSTASCGLKRWCDPRPADIQTTRLAQISGPAEARPIGAPRTMDSEYSPRAGGRLFGCPWIFQRHGAPERLHIDGFLLRLFLPGNDAAMTVAERINLLASRSFMIQGCALALSPVVRADGAGVVPLLILILALRPGRIGSAIGLSPMLGDDAIWWSFRIVSGFSLTLDCVHYRYGTWRKKTPPSPPEDRAPSGTHDRGPTVSDRGRRPPALPATRPALPAATAAKPAPARPRSTCAMYCS